MGYVGYVMTSFRLQRGGRGGSGSGTGAPVSEAEVRYRIEQAFSIAPAMTISMLNAFLNARVPIPLRTSVLEEMKTDGLITSERRILRSYKGQTSQVTILHWQRQKVGD